MRPACRRMLAALWDDQSGFGLIEVVVSSMLLALVASGLYLGLDGASVTSAANKHRSLASVIAQQDQDRMRAMAVTELSNYRATSRQTVGTVTYVIASSASWITDDTGTASCTSAQARAHYLRIASSVTWPGMKIRPVTLESVVAPPAGSFGSNLGSLAVQVRDRDGNGVPGVSVALTGPQSYTDTTNEIGCVLWGFLPATREGVSYTVALSRAGYVDPSGAAAPSRATGVTGEAISTLAFDYDAAGSIDATFQTLDRAGGRPIAAGFTPYTVVSSHWSVPLLVLRAPQPQDKTYFPFADPYGAYAGICVGARPDTVGYDGRVPLVTVPRGGGGPVTLFEPPVDLLVTQGGRPVQGAIVKLAGTGAGCGPLPDRTTGADGYMTDRALPYGPYNVCVQATVSGTTYAMAGRVDNIVSTGVPVARATFALTTVGTCP